MELKTSRLTLISISTSECTFKIYLNSRPIDEKNSIGSIWFGELANLDIFNGFWSQIANGRYDIRGEIYPEYQNKGYGTESAIAIKNHMHSIGLIPTMAVLEENVPAKKSAIKAGFKMTDKMGKTEIYAELENEKE